MPPLASDLIWSFIMNTTLKIKCPAKVNLSLDVISRRDDGYHNLETIMHTVKLWDILTVSYVKASTTRLTLSANMGFLPTDDKNLCAKAAHMFLESANLCGNIAIHIQKHIPVGAGLGGGSSDAAGTLLALSRLTNNPLSASKLTEIAKSIGADVPFFLYGGCMLATGIGELLTPLPKLKNITILIAKPKYGISTPTVYKNLVLDEKTPHPHTKSVIKAIETNDIKQLAASAGNVLETAVCHNHPEINQYKNIMKSCGAAYALMSGSGSSVFGVFEDRSMAIYAANRLRRLTTQVYLA